MDVVTFRRVQLSSYPSAQAWWTIQPMVNGVALADLAREVELPSAQAAGQANLAGSHGGLSVEHLWPSPHFPGEPTEKWFGDGDTILLGCECGEAGCWPLTAKVEVDETTVRWNGF